MYEFVRILVSASFWGVLVTVAYTDMHTMTIPDKYVIAAGGIGILSALLFPEISLPERIVGMFIVSLPLLVIALVVPGAFGGGDIKFMAACGIFLGWERNLYAFFWALLLAGIYSIWLLLIKKSGRKTSFAFGPFLCMGMCLSFLFSI